jgi:hypothetical protein
MSKIKHEVDMIVRQHRPVIREQIVRTDRVHDSEIGVCEEEDDRPEHGKTLGKNQHPYCPIPEQI